MPNGKVEKIVKPDVFIATTLDDISRKLTQLLGDYQANKEQNKRLIEINTEMANTDSKMLKEMLDEKDEGEYMRRTDTATTSFTIIDVVGTLSFPVKGWEIHNDGSEVILFAYNLMPVAMNMDIDINNTRFSRLLAGDNISFRFNRRTIRNIYLRTESGTSDYRLWLVW